MPAAFTPIPISASARTNKYPPTPLNLFALFHIFFACFGAVSFRFSSPFLMMPAEHCRRAFGYDGSHAGLIRR